MAPLRTMRSIYVTASEWRSWKAAAKKLKLRGVSELVRVAVSKLIGELPK